jgi:glycerate kinase
MGMLTALGAVFEDAQGRALRGSGAELSQVARVSLDGVLETLGALPLTMMSDVTNPLLGETGATAVYGAQKGADAPTRATLEAGMAHYADALERTTGRPLRDLPGAGAAGGMGAALYALGAAMRPGIEAVLDAAGFDAAARGAALVITGEGRIDGQSVRFGKAAAGVARRSAALGIPVIALVGGMQEGAEALYDVAESSILTTVNAPMTVKQAMVQAEPLLQGAADRLFRLLKIGQKLS